MLSCELWILRSPVYSPLKYKVFSYYNKGYKIVFFSRSYWVYMFPSQEIFVKLINLCMRKRRLNKVKFKRNPLCLFSEFCCPRIKKNE